MTENKPGEPSKPAQPSQGTGQSAPSSSSSSSSSKSAKKEEPTQLGSNQPLAPEHIKTDKAQITSASTLQEDRVPGVQYPASSNQLPVDFESQDQETPVQKAEREATEAVAKLDENNDTLVAAAASGDAQVHELLARRGVAQQNADEAGVQAVDNKLAQLFGA
jgi:hypothetical protein